MSEGEHSGKPCPTCGKPASGNFCQHCGGSLGGRFCNKCGSPLADGAKFCNKCGAPRSAAGTAPPAAVAAAASPAPPARSSGRAARGGASRGTPEPTMAGGNLPWIIAGTAIFGLILVVGFSMVRPEGPAPAPGAAPGGAAGAASGAAPDISNMTPIDAADRLFDRVMRSLAAGDTAGALAFQPMGVQAYARAEPLNLDGVFHMAMLEMLTTPADALASANRILEAEPDHIFGLGLAAQAHLALGDTAAARTAYQQILDVYNTEAGRPLEEYQAHSQILNAYRADAEAFLNEG